MNVTHSSISKLMVTVRSQQGSELLLINPSISKDLINLFILTFLSGGQRSICNCTLRYSSCDLNVSCFIQVRARHPGKLSCNANTLALRAKITSHCRYMFKRIQGTDTHTHQLTTDALSFTSYCKAFYSLINAQKCQICWISLVIN